MLSALVRSWWLIVLQGVLAVLFGLMAFVLPGRTLGILVTLFGAYALADGVVALFRTFRAGATGVPWWPFLLQGIVSVGAGIVTFSWPGMTALFLLYCIAAWALVSGVVQIFVALALRKELEGEWLVILSGLLSVLLGLWLFAAPGEGALAIVWLIGSFAVVFGVVLIAAGLQLRGLSRRLDELAGPRPA
jgi:uncharacterized membrane protein HdeD (DUF308 family)